VEMRFKKISLEIMQTPNDELQLIRFIFSLAKKKIDMRLSVDRQKEYEQKKAKLFQLKTEK